MQLAKFLLLGACAVATPSLAHHSAAQFDFGQTVMIEGTVKFIDVRNPHIKLILEVENEDGELKEIEYEGHSRNNVFRRGWRPDMLDVGDTVTIGIAPMRDGEEGGYIKDFHLQDGTVF